MVTDPISNFVTRLKNSVLAKRSALSIDHSNVLEHIAAVLEKEGYLKTLSKKRKKNQKVLDLELALASDGSFKLTDIVRVSKSSKRVYLGFRDLRPYKNGYGRYILSTPKGIMTDIDAKKSRLGGEVLAKVW
jgi:small subunit ribosomal protein S8